MDAPLAAPMAKDLHAFAYQALRSRAPSGKSRRS
jgi:hypothetical protein